MGVVKWIRKWLRKLSSITTPFLGVTWSPGPQEQEIVYRLLQELADRRLLHFNHDLGGQGGGRRVEQSVGVMREAVTQTLGALTPESKGRNGLEIIRRALHDFHNLLERYIEEDPGWFNDDSARFSALRATLMAMQETIFEESARLEEIYEIPRRDEEDSERLNRYPL